MDFRSDLSLFAVLALINKVNPYPKLEYKIIDDQTIECKGVFLELSNNSIIVRVVEDYGLYSTNLFHIDAPEDVTTALDAFFDRIPNASELSEWQKVLFVFGLSLLIFGVAFLVIIKLATR